MSNRIDTAPEEKAGIEQFEDEAECHHYWVIESPNGPTSRGFCRFCGAERDFLNSPPEFTFARRGGDQAETRDSPNKKTGSKRVAAYNKTPD